MTSEFQKGFNFLDIPHNTENVFDLDSPANYYCRIFRYHISHSSLCIELSREDDEKLYLNFAGVQCFEFSQFWKGANFILSGDIDEKKRLLRKNHPSLEPSIEKLISDIAETSHLLVNQTEDGIVKLLFGYRHVLLTNKMSL